MIDLYPPEPAPEDDENGSEPLYSPRKLKKMKHQAELDLHGCTVGEAEERLQAFLQQAFHGGLKKVLVIFGKGCHSEGGPVLSGAVRHYLESSPLAGQLIVPPAKYGGSGALWVMIRKR